MAITGRPAADAQLRRQRVKERLADLITVLGRVFESEARGRLSNYRPEEFQEAVDALLKERFIERAQRHGTPILVLIGAPLEDLLQDGGSEV